MHNKSFFRIKHVLNGDSRSKLTYDYFSVINKEEIPSFKSDILYDSKAEILAYIMFLKEALKSFDVVITNLKVRDREGHYFRVSDRYKDNKFEIKNGIDNELVASSVRNYRKQSHVLFEIDRIKIEMTNADVKYD